MKAKKRLGQNFLVNKLIINKIVDEVLACKKDLIIEIGPGKGALTKLLKEKKAFVLAYEIDLDLKQYLEKLEDNQTTIVWQDFLKSNIKQDLKKFKYEKLYIIGNLPYYITTPIIEHIINSDLIFEKLVIMVQKEVAQRFLALPHNKEYGYITVILNYFFDIFKIIDVPRSAFNPIPNVDSMVLSLKPKKLKENLDFLKFQEFLKDCFHQKRKTLKNNLNGYDWDKIKKVLNASELNENIRAEELSLEMFIKIFRSI